MKPVIIITVVVAMLGMIVSNVFAELPAWTKPDAYVGKEFRIDSVEVWGNDDELKISMVAKVPVDFMGWIVVFDKNNAVVWSSLMYDQTETMEPSEFRKIFASDIRMKTVEREVAEGMGIIQIFQFDGSNWFSTGSKALLTQKIDITRYHLKYFTHEVQIKNGKFIPSELTIDYNDSIKFIVDCDDCYNLQWIEEMGDDSNRLLRTKFLDRIGSTGTFKIVDFFEPKDEFTYHVRTLSETKTFNESKTNSQDSSTEQPSTPLKNTQVGMILGDISIENESRQKIPDWVKNTMQWYLDGSISEDEMINAIQFLVKTGIIKID